MLLHTDTYKTFERKLIQVRLGDRQKINAHPCGYIAPDGKIFSCAPYEHIDKIKTILRNKEVGMPGEKYKEFEDYIFDNDACTHNYSLYDQFVLCELGWVKIAAYGIGCQEGPMENWLFNWELLRMYDLTPEQTEIIFPK